MITPKVFDMDMKCYECGRDVTEEDYCPGCGEYICFKCDVMEPQRTSPHRSASHFSDSQGG